MHVFIKNNAKSSGGDMNVFVLVQEAGGPVGGGRCGRSAPRLPAHLPAMDHLHG